MGIEGFKEQQEWQFRTQKQSQPEYKPAQATESLSDIAERDAADAQLEAAFNEEKSKTMKEEDNKENLIDAKVDKIIKDCKKAIEKSAEEFGVDKYIMTFGNNWKLNNKARAILTNKEIFLTIILTSRLIVIKYLVVINEK